MKFAPLAQLLFILAAAVGVYSFVRASQNDHRNSSCTAMCQLRPTYAGQDRRVPDFELPDMSGNKVKFSSFLNGKPVVLNFWTKTCKPCLEEMPGLAEMAAVLRRDGIHVVTICTDEGPDAVRDTLQVVLGVGPGDKLPFTVLFDPDTEVVADKFGTSLYPETWLIDDSGVIRARIDGARDWTSAIALDVVAMLDKPLGCPVEFQASRPVGKYARLCGEP